MPFLDFARAALAVFFILVGVFYGTRLIALRNREGIDCADRGPDGTIQHVTHALFHVFRAAILGVVLARVVDPRVDEAIGVIPGLMQPLPVALGLLLILLSFAGTIYVHSYMGRDWRSGVAENETVLITEGPFKRTRNPMFLSIIIGQIGFALALPSLFSALCLVAGLVALMAQARHEEAHLLKRHGEAYQLYAGRTPRWLPRPKRWAPVA